MPNQKTIHLKILEYFTKGICKFVNGLFPPIISNFFSVWRNLLQSSAYNLNHVQCQYSDNTKTVNYRTETVTYIGAQMWNLILENIRNASSFNTFREKNKNWNADLYPCRV